MRLSDIERGNPKAERHAKRIAKHQAEIERDENDGDIPSDVYSEVERLERDGDFDNANAVLDLHWRKSQQKAHKGKSTKFARSKRASKKSQKRVNQLASDYMKD